MTVDEIVERLRAIGDRIADEMTAYHPYSTEGGLLWECRDDVDDLVRDITGKEANRE